MDASQLILSLIKDDQIKQNLNPIVYYCLKLVYSPEFSKRSRYFGRAIKRLYDELGNNLGLEMNNLDKINMENTITFDMALDSLDKENDDTLNVTVSKDSYLSVNKLIRTDWKWCFEHLVDYDDEYIMDKEDDYILLTLVKNYIFGDEPPKTSTLMMCYNIFVSSIELMFVFKLITSFPQYCFQRKETHKMEEYFIQIKQRINDFYDAWCVQYPEKYKRNRLIREIIGEKKIEEESQVVDYTYSQFTMYEPILNSKYISFTKLIKEGPFCFEIDEVARQICLIDHEMLSSLNYSDFTQFVVKKETPKSFDKFFIREKQLQCYILIFITMHNNLENKKNMVQNFISLAHTLKLLNNQQTCNTIIAAFNIVGITKKKLLWKLIEKKYRDIYSNLEKELNDMELNENPMLRERRDDPVVLHIRYIITLINNLVIQMKGISDQNSETICQEYKDFIVSMNENAKHKYYFFKMNPLYDFFKFGFLEVFKPKRWNLKLRFDFSGYTEKLEKLDQLLNYLIKNFQNTDI